MSWNPKDEYYDETQNDIDYANPAYYQQETPKTPRSAQPVQSLEPLPSYPGYPNETPEVPGKDAELMSPYTGPASLEGYTVDAGSEQREIAKRGTTEGSNRRKGLAGGLGGIVATIVALLVKFKTVLLLFSKFGFAGITALISIGAYALFFGWPFAVGLVALLFIHEMGHAAVMKMKGIPIGGLIFIPLLGAAVLMRQMPKNAKDEAEVGIAGPITGAIAAAACLALAHIYPHTIWAPLAYFGFFINLFNLVPVVPFDGGRVLGAIDRRLWILGFLGLVAFQIWSFIQYHSFSIWLLFFIVIAGTQLWSRRAIPDTPEAQAYYAVPVGERIILTLVYFGLAATLVLGMTISHGLIFGLGQ